MSAHIGSNDGFILLLALSGQSSYAETSRAPLVKAISKKLRVVSAYTQQEALAHLSGFGLSGVIVADGGVAKKNQAVLQKLAQYTRSGGTVVAALSFSSFVTEDEFRGFFRAFGLEWKRGSYHRQIFYSNKSNEIGSNTLLADSYSMKALQVEGIYASMAVYQSVDSNGRVAQPSSFIVPHRQSQQNEAPIVVTTVGTGRLGYVGDVNDERESMNVCLAMLNILDSTTCIDISAPQEQPAPAAMSFADMFPSLTQPARSIPPARTTATGASLRGAQGRAMQPVASSSIPPRNATDPTIVIVSLDDQGSTLEKNYKHQLDALRAKVKVVMVSRSSDLLQSLESPSTIGVYLADGGILKWKNKTIYPMLVEYAEGGGKIVCGGLFPAALTAKNATTFFEAFGLRWTVGGSRLGYHELQVRSELAKRNPGLLPDVYKMKPQSITHITLDVPVYIPAPKDPPGSEEEEEWDAPIVYVRICSGSLGYVGDLKGEVETTSVILAMFGILQTPAVAPPPPERQPKKFVILVAPSNLTPLEVEHEYNDLIKKVAEKVEVVRGLSPERVADLMASPDLSAVLVSSASITEASPATAYMKSKLVAFTNSGGTLVLLGSFAQDLSLQASRDFFLNNWGLDWTAGIRKRVEKEVRLNESNSLVNGRRKKWLPKAPQWEGAHTLTSTRSEDVVYVPTRWAGGDSPGFAQFDGERGRFFEGPALYTRVGDGGKGKVGFVGGRKDVEETGKVVVTMVVSGFQSG